MPFNDELHQERVARERGRPVENRWIGQRIDDPAPDLAAMARAQDIGFVRVGQAARVKVTAYDFSLFGSLEGTVRSISPDVTTTAKGESFSNVRVETRTRAIETLDKKLPVIPGMQVQVDIITGSKTVLQYLSKPLVAMKENAFRER